MPFTTAILRAPAAAAILAAAALGPGLVACAPAPRSSTLTTDDLVETTNQMAEQLRSSDFLADRSAESPPVVIALNKVQNLTSDLIPEAQQWWMMARVRDQLSVSTMAREKSVRFVIPQEFLAKAKEDATVPQGFAAERDPTHVMAATFLSATREAGTARTDVYLCEYRITSLDTGELVWTGKYEFKRQAFGRAYD